MCRRGVHVWLTEDDHVDVGVKVDAAGLWARESANTEKTHLKFYIVASCSTSVLICSGYDKCLYILSVMCLDLDIMTADTWMAWQTHTKLSGLNSKRNRFVKVCTINVSAALTLRWYMKVNLFAAINWIIGDYGKLSSQNKKHWIRTPHNFREYH